MSTRQYYGLGLTDGTALTSSLVGTSDTAFSGGVSGGITILSGGLSVPSNTTSQSAKWPAVATSTGRSLRFYFRPGSTLATVPIVTIYGADGTTVCGYIGVNSAGQFVLRNQANGSITAGIVGFTAGNLYRLELTASSITAGSVQFRVYSVNETTHAETIILSSGEAALGTATLPSTWSFGRMSGTAAGPGWIGLIKDVDTAGSVVGPDNIAPTVALTGNQNLATSTGFTIAVTAGDADGSIASYAAVVVAASSTATPTLTGATTASITGTSPSTAGHLVTIRETVTDNVGATAVATTEIRTPVAGSTTATTLAIDAVDTVGTWSNVGGASTDGAATADASDATYLETAAVSATEQYKGLRVQPSFTRTGATFPLRLGMDTGTGNAIVKMYEGTTLRKTFTTQALNATPTDYTFTVDSTTVASIVDWGNVVVRIGFTS